MIRDVKFNFERFPELGKPYDIYCSIKSKAYKYSMKDGTKNGEKMEKAIEECRQYGYSILAPIIYNIFSKIKPRLYRRIKGPGYFNWDDVFGKPFDELDDSEKQNLIHLLDGEFLYRLPEKYYKPRFKDKLHKIFKRLKWNNFITIVITASGTNFY